MPASATDGAPSDTDGVGQRIVEAAAALLVEQGREAATTRAVAARAGVQPPAIYRHFADMPALLDAVAEHGFGLFLAAKSTEATLADPVDELRRAWLGSVEFGRTHPALFALMYGNPRRGTDSSAYRMGMEVLLGKIGRVAAAGRLRVQPDLAVSIMQAMSSGAVLATAARPRGDIDASLDEALGDALVTAITTEPVAVATPTAGTAARALRAHLSTQDSSTLSAGERALLDELLDRLGATDATAARAEADTTHG